MEANGGREWNNEVCTPRLVLENKNRSIEVTFYAKAIELAKAITKTAVLDGKLPMFDFPSLEKHLKQTAVFERKNVLN